MAITMFCTNVQAARQWAKSLDLFAAVRRRALTVTQVPRRAARSWSWSPAAVGARGDSGSKRWQSGHWYSRCATAAPRSAASCFRRTTVAARRRRKMGCRVSSRGPPFGKEGEFGSPWSICSHGGGGLWQLAFEKAKAALAKDGLLDGAQTAAAPYPLRIAVVTSPDGAPCRTSSR